MSQQTVPTGDPLLVDEPRRRPRRPGISLAVIVACQLMVVLDATVVFVALPDIQHSLHFSAPGLSWVGNAYSRRGRCRVSEPPSRHPVRSPS